MPNPLLDGEQDLSGWEYNPPSQQPNRPLSYYNPEPQQPLPRLGNLQMNQYPVNQWQRSQASQTAADMLRRQQELQAARHRAIVAKKKRLAELAKQRAAEIARQQELERKKQERLAKIRQEAEDRRRKAMEEQRIADAKAAKEARDSASRQNVAQQLQGSSAGPLQQEPVYSTNEWNPTNLSPTNNLTKSNKTFIEQLQEEGNLEGVAAKWVVDNFLEEAMEQSAKGLDPFGLSQFYDEQTHPGPMSERGKPGFQVTDLFETEQPGAYNPQAYNALMAVGATPEGPFRPYQWGDYSGLRPGDIAPRKGDTGYWEDQYDKGGNMVTLRNAWMDVIGASFGPESYAIEDTPTQPPGDGDGGYPGYSYPYYGGYGGYPGYQYPYYGGYGGYPSYNVNYNYPEYEYTEPAQNWYMNMLQWRI